MEFQDQFASIASLIAEPSRAIMLWNLLDGRAYTAGELAVCSNISPQSASNHLNKLLRHDIVSIEKQGRHRYYKFSRPEVAGVIESMANLITPSKRLSDVRSENNHGIRYARTCYDHLAGTVGVSITEAMVNQGILIIDGFNYMLTDKGMDWFGKLGIDIEQIKSKQRSFARCCLDWSERKHHLAGALGAAFLQSLLDKDWMRRKRNSREIVITGLGQQELYYLLKLEV